MNTPEEKAIASIKNAIRELGNHYPRSPKDDSITAYAKSLFKNYHPDTVKQACESIQDNAGLHFPSLAELKGLINNFVPLSKRKDNMAEAEWKTRFVQEERQVANIRKEMEKVFEDKTDGTIERYTEAYCKKVFDLDTNDLKSFGLNLSLFTKPALFDLKQSGFKSDLAIKRGISKLKTL